MKRHCVKLRDPPIVVGLSVSPRRRARTRALTQRGARALIQGTAEGAVPRVHAHTRAMTDAGAFEVEHWRP